MQQMKSLLVALTFFAAVHAHAQTIGLDYGVAAEVVQSMIPQDIGQSISTSTNLMANYRNFALEQELAQEAARRGLTERIDVRRRIEDQRRDTLIMALRNEVIRAAEVPNEAKLKAEFKKQAERLIVPAAQKLDVYSISATQTQAIEKARALLESDPGVSETLAKRGFTHISGQLPEPWFTAAQIAPAIWAELIAMGKDDVEVFPDGGNVLVIRKMDEREARPMTYEEAEAPLRQFLMRDSQNKLWNDYVAEKAKTLGF